MKFTKPAIAKLELPTDKSEVIVFDDALPGFGLRIRVGGKRTWIAQFRVGSRQRRLTLGDAARMELEQARTEAKKALNKAGLAIDPQAEKFKARADTGVTLGGVADRYLKAKEKTLRRRSFVETERHLRKGWAALRGRSLADIGRQDVANGLSEMAASRGAVAADRARAALSAMYSWAMREGIAIANPVTATNRPAEPVARDRVLSDGELVEVWSACGDAAYGAIVKLLMLTGQRREEVGGMLWPEINTDSALWSLPGERTKNGRPHDVPLSSAALAIVEALPRRADRDIVFGEGAGPFSGWSKSKSALDRRINERRKKAPATSHGKTKPIAPWRLHDLRRTLATRMGDLGVQPHVVEAVLNHYSGARAGVAGVYNRSLYSAEKRAALELWGEHVTALVSGAARSVVPFKRASSHKPFSETG